MKSEEMVKLLEYKNDEIYLDGVDLSKLTNMFYLTKYDFLLLIRMLFRNDVKGIDKRKCNNSRDYIINVREKDIFDNDDPVYKIKYVVEGDIYVNKGLFEYYRRKIFNFAYSRCSLIADSTSSEYVLREGNEIEAQNLMDEKTENYACFYRSSGKVWNYLVSNVRIDKQERNRMYNILNSLSEKEKVKVKKIEK